jgi:hypothetical protein
LTVGLLVISNPAISVRNFHSCNKLHERVCRSRPFLLLYLTTLPSD